MMGMFDRDTTMLWDAVAVYLACDESLLEIERLPIHVEDGGRLTVSHHGPVIRARLRGAMPRLSLTTCSIASQGHPRTLRRFYPVTKRP
jgi:hypothetical protein